MNKTIQRMTRPLRGRSKGFWIAAAAIVLVLGSGGAWALWPKDPARIIAQLGNDPRKVREAVEQGKISREDAMEAMWTVREQEMDKRMDQYFALTPAQRNQFLDQMINEMEARRREWQQRAASRPAATQQAERRGPPPASQPRNRGNWEQRIAMRQDSRPPERRAQRAEFVAALMKRRAERGLPGWGGGPGRGPGGGHPGGGR